MVEFFPVGFWKTVAMAGMVLFFILGVDLLLGARMVGAFGRILNQKFQFDQIIVKVLSDIKRSSDREYDVDHSVLNGWGRFVLSGILFFGAVTILMNLLPRLQ